MIVVQEPANGASRLKDRTMLAVEPLSGEPGLIKTAFPTRPMRGNPLVNHTAKEAGLVCTNCGNSFLLHADPHLSGGGPYDIS
jgi:hypothetical protein